MGGAPPSRSTPFPDHFSDAAARYAAARPRYPDELFRFLAGLAHRRQRAWDCGTGNGQAAIALANYFDEVCATDASAEQVAEAVAHPGVHYSVQRAESTDFPVASFDLVCVAQALHWFEFDAFFKEVQRVASRGALFAAWGYDSQQVDPLFDDALRRTVLEPLDAFWAPQNRLLWDAYREVPIPFPRLAAPQFEAKLNWDWAQFCAYIETWSATRRCIAAEGRSFLDRAYQELIFCWGEPKATREVRMPLHFVLARVE